MTRRIGKRTFVHFLIKDWYFVLKDEDLIKSKFLDFLSIQVMLKHTWRCSFSPRQILARIRSSERMNRRWSGELLDSNFYWQPENNLHFIRITVWCFIDPRLFPSHMLPDVSPQLAPVATFDAMWPVFPTISVQTRTRLDHTLEGRTLLDRLGRFISKNVSSYVGSLRGLAAEDIDRNAPLTRSLVDDHAVVDALFMRFQLNKEISDSCLCKTVSYNHSAVQRHYSEERRTRRSKKAHVEEMNFDGDLFPLRNPDRPVISSTLRSFSINFGPPKEPISPNFLTRGSQRWAGRHRGRVDSVIDWLWMTQSIDSHTWMIPEVE